MRRALGILGCAALLLGAPASAHPQLWPALAEQNRSADLLLTAPNERKVTMTRIELTAPPTVELEEAKPTPTWQATLEGNRAAWSGGRLEHEQWGQFPLRLRAKAEPGTVQLSVRQLFADGRSVDWPVQLSVTPATSPGGRSYGLPLAAGAFGLVAAASAALVWLVRRRNTLQEQ